MKKIYIDNLGLIVTNKCNLVCKHCLRGCKDDRVIRTEVIESTFDQIESINNLCLCGGEITLSLEAVENIFKHIIKNNIVLSSVNTTINGTIYSKDLIELFEYMDKYISKINNDNKKHVSIAISNDMYHEEEMRRLNIIDTYDNNVDNYSKSGIFSGIRELNKEVKLIREGFARDLDLKLTKKLKPMKLYVTYASGDKFDRNGLCKIGPLITINPDGIITECNGSIMNQKMLYRYGDVSFNRIEDVSLLYGKILRPKAWEKKCKKEMGKYLK